MYLGHLGATCGLGHHHYQVQLLYEAEIVWGAQRVMTTGGPEPALRILECLKKVLLRCVRDIINCPHLKYNLLGFDGQEYLGSQFD